MHARSVGVNTFEAIIVDACLHDRAFDPQCEGDRSGWLMNLVAASGSEARIVNELMPQFDAPTDEFWDATQRCQIARELAQRGYPGARSRLYACFRKWPDTANVIGAEDIVALDGADGLLHVAQHFGTLLQQERGFWVDDGPIRSFDERQGSGSGRRILERAAEHSTSVAAYLGRLDERDREKRSSSNTTEQSNGHPNIANVKFDAAGPRSHIERMQEISAAEVIRQIETEDPQQIRFWFVGWGRHAAPGGLAMVFEAMTRQSEPGRLCKYLRVFSRRALPAFDTRLLEYAGHANADVRRLAHKAMSNYAHPGVRRLAIERLRAGLFCEGELGLLKSTYQSGDAALIEQVLRVPKDRDQLHGLAYGLIELFETNTDPESASLMLFVYEETPCSNCRARAVEILASTGQLPGWLIEECRDDCSEEIRLIAKNSG